MNYASLMAAGLLLATVTACGAPQDNFYFYKDPDIGKYKTGNRVELSRSGIAEDIAVIELLKQGKFKLAADRTPTAAAATPAAKGAEAAPAPSTDGFDFIFRVAAAVGVYNVVNNSLPGLYSFSVTTKTGEIVYIKVLGAADLKVSIKETLDEVAGLLL